MTANSWIKKPGGAAPLGGLSPYLASIVNVANSKTTGRGPNAWSPEEPLRTITSASGHAVTTPYLASIAHGDSGGRREYPMNEPLGTVTRGGIQHAVVEPHLLAMKGTARRSCDVLAPHPTVLAGGGHSATVAAFLAQQNGGPRMDGHSGRDPREPLSTVTAAGSQQTPIAAFFAKYYGTGDGARHDEPTHTITVRDRFAHTEAQLAAPPFAPEHHARAREVAAFLRAQGAWQGGEFVTLTIDGAEFVVVDIGLRMLTPRELFNAQGFPADYVIEGVWMQAPGNDFKWHAFTKDVQVSCCGNSVCPPLAEVIVAANCGHLAIHRQEAMACPP